MSDYRKDIETIIAKHPKQDTKAIRAELWAFMKSQKLNTYDYQQLVATMHSVLNEKGIK